MRQLTSGSTGSFGVPVMFRDEIGLRPAAAFELPAGFRGFYATVPTGIESTICVLSGAGRVLPELKPDAARAERSPGYAKC